MSTDIAWQHRDSLPAATDDGQGQSSLSSSASVQEWDPNAFLNPTMFIQESPTNATPPLNATGNNPGHFSSVDQHVALGHPPLHQPVPTNHHLSSNGSYNQDAFQGQFMRDLYAPPAFNDPYGQSQSSGPMYESGRYRPPTSQTPDLESSMTNLGLNQHEMFYPGGVPFQQQPPNGQLAPGHPFEYHPAADRASPHPRNSPFVNHSFAQQQDFSGSIERRPSTADSVHSVHVAYPDEFNLGPSMISGPMNGNGHNAAGIVPSALHGFNQRSNSGSFHPHLPPDQPNGRGYMPQSNPSAAPFISGQAGYATHQAPQYLPENFNIAPRALDADATAYPPVNSSSSEVTLYLQPILQQYMETRNRIGFGERTVIVMASKVAQKSYGQERRFLCPPPTAIMIGNAWWTETALGRDDRRPPRVTVSISGESTPPESTVEWTSTSGKTVDLGEAPPEPSPFIQEDISNFQPNGGALKQQQTQTYIGRAVGKQLFISDERQKKVEALVKIVAQGTDDEPERVIGVFPSKPIKVISKPSKKRQSAKNMELCINHGSTVSLFHRLRAQTVSTKYLCVSGSGYSFKGSDGAPLPGVDNPHRGNTPSFVAKIGTWDPFVIYIVDVTKPQGPDTISPIPLQPDYPAPPPNAIGIMHHGSHIPIYYNQTVVLQCLTSGVVSPVLIIRKVERDTTVVGGGLQEGAKGVPDHFCAPGEVCGDPVSQLHKVAFEVYDPNKGGPAPGSPGATGAFLSCMGDKVNTYRPSDGRTWNNSEMSSRSQSPAIPDSPGASSAGSATDYFSTGSPVDSSSLDGHGASVLPVSSDGGRVNTRRVAKRSNTTSSGPISKGPSKARRRVNSVGSNGSASGGYVSSSARYGLSEQSMSSGALWSIDIGESSVWTIVGTEQIRYNFYVPPNMPGSRASGVPLKPVTPFPTIVKYLPPDRAAENPMKHGGVSRMLVNNGMKPDPRNGPLLTIYGENFNKSDPPLVFFGIEPSPFVDVRCQEVLACLPPPGNSTTGNGSPADVQIKMEHNAPNPVPIFIARSDGVIYPSSVVFYGK